MNAQRVIESALGIKRQTFLSIDVDYWSLGHRNPSISLDDFLRKITIGARSKGIPISAVMNHNQMLRKVCMSPARRLYNIDTHSDLASSNVSNYNCGTWISYITWRREGEYIWHCPPHQKSFGDCNGGENIFTDKRVKKHLSDWGNVDRVASSVIAPVDELLKDCVEICVCMSPCYSDGVDIESFRRWKNSFKIPYQKGTLNERYWEIEGRKPQYYEHLYNHTPEFISRVYAMIPQKLVETG